MALAIKDISEDCGLDRNRRAVLGCCKAWQKDGEDWNCRHSFSSHLQSPRFTVNCRGRNCDSRWRKRPVWVGLQNTYSDHDPDRHASGYGTDGHPLSGVKSAAADVYVVQMDLRGAAQGVELGCNHHREVSRSAVRPEDPCSCNSVIVCRYHQSPAATHKERAGAKPWQGKNYNRLTTWIAFRISNLNDEIDRGRAPEIEAGALALHR
jgi:hypothetical protein